MWRAAHVTQSQTCTPMHAITCTYPLTHDRSSTRTHSLTHGHVHGHLYIRTRTRTRTCTRTCTHTRTRTRKKMNFLFLNYTAGNEVSFNSKQKLLFTQLGEEHVSAWRPAPKWNMQTSCDKGVPPHDIWYFQRSDKSRCRTPSLSCLPRSWTTLPRRSAIFISEVTVLLQSGICGLLIAWKCFEGK